MRKILLAQRDFNETPLAVAARRRERRSLSLAARRLQDLHGYGTCTARILAERAGFGFGREQ